MIDRSPKPICEMEDIVARKDMVDITVDPIMSATPGAIMSSFTTGNLVTNWSNMDCRAVSVESIPNSVFLFQIIVMDIHAHANGKIRQKPNFTGRL